VAMAAAGAVASTVPVASKGSGRTGPKPVNQPQVVKQKKQKNRVKTARRPSKKAVETVHTPVEKSLHTVTEQMIVEDTPLAVGNHGNTEEALISSRLDSLLAMLRPLMASMHFLLNAISSEGKGEAFCRGLEAAKAVVSQATEIAEATTANGTVTRSSRSSTAPPTDHAHRVPTYQ